MQHSIAAKYAARTSAKFVPPSAQARERRLGLRRHPLFEPAERHETCLRPDSVALLESMRASWRAITPVQQDLPRFGAITRPDRIEWSRAASARSAYRSRALPAPWRG